MTWVRQYILSVVAAAIVCAIVKALMEDKSTPSVVVKMLAGVLMAVTVIAPFVKMDIGDITDYINSFHTNADAAVQSGVAYSTEEMGVIIKDKTQAYILDKAQTLGAEVEAEILLSDETPPIPCAVTLKGRVSPYVKQRLSQYITEELGIAEENQTWI